MGVDMAGPEPADDDRQGLDHQPAAGQLRGSRSSRSTGVTDITHANWFGGYYQDVRNQFADLRGRPGELAARSTRRSSSCPRIRRRRGSPIAPARSSAPTRRRSTAGRSGRRVPIQGTIYRRPDGGPWEFTIDGIYDSKIKGADKTSFFFNYQFLRETIPDAERLPRSGTTGTCSRSPIPTARRRSPRRSTRCSPTRRRRPRPTPRRRSSPTGPSRSATSARS